MATLLLLKGSNSGQRFEVRGEHTVIGRHPECDIVVDAGAVSRQHARINQSNGDFFLEDLKSRNGTYLNGRQITEPTQLAEKDRIKICDLLFTFHLEDPDKVPIDVSGGSRTTPVDLVVSDEEADANASSTIMSTLDVASSSKLRLEVKPEAKLRAVLEISRNLSNTLALDEVLPKILESLFKIFPQADRGFILLYDARANRLVPKAVRFRRQDREDDSIAISRTIVNKAMQEGKAILSADAASDSRFDMSQSIADFQIRSMICAPLMSSSGQAQGIIHIDTKSSQSKFQQEDLDVLSSAAMQAAQAVENASLHEHLAAEQRLLRELEFASEVQGSFLPKQRPEIPHFAFFDYYKPARHIGGDYYGYVTLPDDHLAVAVGDVAGKGVPAALLMASLSAQVSFCLAAEPTPADAINRLNKVLTGSGSESRFITFVLAVLDLKNYTMTLVNAGHVAPLLRRLGAPEVKDLGSDTGGVPLGVAPEIPYQQADFPLKPGDLVVLSSDGVTEAMNPDNELYGSERLRQKIAAGPERIEALGNEILEDVRSFAGERSQNDDITLVCFGRTA
jgi:serine phosphatase RsbU (regulator of sigma subunit)/pSer/pThr/pTyr-binding forkhead associated (FHA) protein